MRADLTPRRLGVIVLATCLLLATGGATRPAEKTGGAGKDAAAPRGPAALAKAAAKSALHPARAFPVYEGLAFGADLAALTDYMRQRMKREYAPKKLATPDVRQRDLLQAEAEAKVEEFSKSHVEFRGQPTGYDVSILSGEFRHGARQEMRIHRTAGGVHSYFLLSEGTLWKLIRQVDAAELSFDDLLTKLRSVYGKPARTETRTVYREGEAVEVPERVTWDDGTFLVQAIDMGTLYQSRVIRWALVDVENRVAGGAGGSRVDIKRQYKTEDILQDIMTPEDDPSIDSVVDRLLDDTAPKKGEPADKKK